MRTEPKTLSLPSALKEEHLVHEVFVYDTENETRNVQ